MRKFNLILIFIISIVGCVTLQSVEEDLNIQLALAHTAGDITGLIYAKEIHDATAIYAMATILTNISQQLIQGKDLSEQEKLVLQDLTLRDAILCSTISCILARINFTELQRITICVYSVSAAEAMLEYPQEAKP